jgi:transposase
VEFSKYKSSEFKVIVIDNAGFHTLLHYDIPKNICLIRIPPYSPGLNPSEKIWHYIKQKFKNKVFENLDNVKTWLHKFVVNELNRELLMSITHNKIYNVAFVNHLDI